MRTIKLYAAIDLLEGEVVRVRKGALEDKTVYGSDPTAMARQWADAGADGIHLVDLRGAVAGKYSAIKLLEKLCRAVDIPVQTGGGVRDFRTAQDLLYAGAPRVVVGTAATAGDLNGWLSLGAENLLIAADVKDEKVAINGWTGTAAMTPREFLGELADAGFSEALVTDVSRDGMLGGVSAANYRGWGAGLPIGLIGSGGIAGPEDVRALAMIEEISGVVLGKALYENRLDIAALKAEMAA